jgi:hypothetical protein
VCLKVRDDANSERRSSTGPAPALHCTKNLEWQEVGTQDRLRLELSQEPHELAVGMLREAASEGGQLAQTLRIVRFVEEQPVQLRCVLDQFDVAVDIKITLHLRLRSSRSTALHVV